MAPVRPIESKTAGWLRPASMIVGIYICPVVLLLTGVIPFELRFHVLVIMSLLAVALAFSRHSAASLGLSLPTFWGLMRWSVLPSVLLIGVIILLDLPHRRIDSSHLAIYFFFVFVSAPAQEFLYRGFLFAELGETRIPPKAIVLLSAGLFGFMHIIYRDVATVLFTLGAGFVWAVVFNTTRRVCIVAVSHAALGVMAIRSGLI
jgi:hypothetical protein